MAKKYKVKVTTVFVYEEDVEAESSEEAKKIMEAAIDEGTVDAVSDTDNFETSVEVVGEVKDKEFTSWED